MIRRLPRVSVLAAVVSILGLLTTSASPAVADEESEFVKQNSTLFKIIPDFGVTDDDCVGNSWIGVNQLGYVTAYTSISCGIGHYWVMAENHLTEGSLVNILTKSEDRCSDLAIQCKNAYAGTGSVVGVPGKTYCSMGFGDSLDALRSLNHGHGSACITIDQPSVPKVPSVPSTASQPALCSPPSNPPTAKHYINIFTTAPAYNGPSTQCERAGENYSSTNPQYVFCRRQGDEVRQGSDYNHWWLWTDLDTGGQGWISAYYIQGQGNDQADDMNTGAPIPAC
jgi:hypothetical protein